MSRSRIFSYLGALYSPLYLRVLYSYVYVYCIYIYVNIYYMYIICTITYLLTAYTWWIGYPQISRSIITFPCCDCFFGVSPSQRLVQGTHFRLAAAVKWATRKLEMLQIPECTGGSRAVWKPLLHRNQSQRDVHQGLLIMMYRDPKQMLVKKIGKAMAHCFDVVLYLQNWDIVMDKSSKQNLNQV